MAGFMSFEKRVVNPLRKLWRHLYRRISAQNIKSRGIYILYEDVRSCQDEDVHVLWSMVVDLQANGRPVL